MCMVALLLAGDVDIQRLIDDGRISPDGSPLEAPKAVARRGGHLLQLCEQGIRSLLPSWLYISSIQLQSLTMLKMERIHSSLPLKEELTFCTCAAYFRLIVNWSDWTSRDKIIK